MQCCRPFERPFLVYLGHFFGVCVLQGLVPWAFRDLCTFLPCLPIPSLREKHGANKMASKN